MNDISFHPVLPWPILIALLIAIAGLIVWTLFISLRSVARVAVLSGYRLLALAVVAFVMMQPQQQRHEVTILRPQIAVLADNSISMTDPVDPSQPLRSARVAEFLNSPGLADVRKDFDVRVFTLDQAELAAENPRVSFALNTSNILTGISQVQDHFRGQPLAALLLLTDGLDTSGAGKPESIAFSAPVFTFELEKPFVPKRRKQRISIAGADFPPRVVTGWRSDIRIGVAASGMNGQSIPIELWRDGKKVGDASTSFNEDEQTRQLAFQVSHEAAGTEQYEVRVRDAAADKEARAYPFSIEVLEPGKRVLYIQNKLGFDLKFLRKAIVSNRNLQLSAFVRWVDGRLVSLDDRADQAVLDLSAKALMSNAVVILGDLAPDTLPPEGWRNIREFVDHGGGLVLLGGPKSFPNSQFAKNLGQMLPVKVPAEYREGDFPIRLTETGLHHPVFGPLFAEVKNFPPLISLNASDEVAPTAEVLMEAIADGKSKPLVAAIRSGQGRVVCVMTDSVWRWRLGAKAWKADKSPYDTFWAQLMDWLIPKEDQQQAANSIELFTERSSYVLGEKPEVRAIIHTVSGRQPGTLQLTVKTPDDKTFDYAMRPGLLQSRSGKSTKGFIATVEPNVAGIFKASASFDPGSGKIDGAMRLVVTRPATEITGKPINRELLQKVAEASKGGYQPLGEWEKWRKQLHFEEQHFTRLELVELWNYPVVLAALMLLLAADWITRKVWHLP